MPGKHNGNAHISSNDDWGGQKNFWPQLTACGPAKTLMRLIQSAERGRRHEGHDAKTC
jgi:hypothetical protein